MKITITLTDAQVKGIKNYLKEVSDIQKPTNENVKREIEGYVSNTLYCPRESISDYIKREEDKLN